MSQKRKEGEALTDSRKVLSLEVGKLTDIGKIRQHLVDSLGFYKPAEPDLLYTRGELFLVADGIGGQELGALAARTATDIIIKSYYDKSAPDDIETALKHAFNLANMQIIEMNASSSSYIQAGAAVTCAVIQRGTLAVAHIGNCRLYLIKAHSIQQCTHDHLFSGETTAQPTLRKANQKTPVSHALGWESNVEIDYFSLNLKPNDTILLCTDGLYKILDNREIARIALKYSPQTACEKYISLVTERGAPDNVTTILIKIAGLVTIPGKLAHQPEDGINLIRPETKRPDQNYRFRKTTMPIETLLAEEEDFSTPPPEIPPRETPDEYPPDEPTELAERIQPPISEKPISPSIDSSRRPPRGMKRRSSHYDSDSKFDFKKYLPIAASVLVAFLLTTLIFIVLMRERANTLNQATDEKPEILIPATKIIPDDSLQDSSAIPGLLNIERPDSVAAVDQPPITVPPPVVTALSEKVRIFVINGKKLSAPMIDQLIAGLQSPELGDAELIPQNIVSSLTTASKIIYRFPANGNAQTVQNTSRAIQKQVEALYKKQLEIVPCDISIIIGKDFSLQNLRLKGLKRRVLKTAYSGPVHIEILNGSGKGGVAKGLQSALEGIYLDENKYIQIIDARNALNFNYPQTLIKCQPTEIQLATQLARYLGFDTPAPHIVTADLEDIQLVLGKDFPTF